MYHETFHPVSDDTLKWALENKSFNQEERDFIAGEVAKANAACIREFKVTLPSGEYVEFQNGILIGGEAQ
jgi:hypothetical protein